MYIQKYKIILYNSNSIILNSLITFINNSNFTQIIYSHHRKTFLHILINEKYK